MVKLSIIGIAPIPSSYRSACLGSFGDASNECCWVRDCCQTPLGVAAVSAPSASVALVRTADHLQHVLIDYQHALEEAESRLNELNVFPIADSDTGTNLKLSVQAIVRSLFAEHDLSLAEVSSRVSSAALASSRGNSGLIFGQYLSAFSAALVEDPWPEEWAEALRCAARQARATVLEPVEGTILTVADRAACAEGDSAPAILASAAGLAEEAVVQTQFQLEVLKESGVVDAGGVGLALFLRTLSSVVSSEPEFTIADRIAAPQRIAGSRGIAAPQRRFSDTATAVRGYELQFNCLASQCGGLEAVKTLVGSLGHDVAIGSSGDLLAVHVHAEDLGPVVEGVLSLSPTNIRIEALLVAELPERPTHAAEEHGA